MRKPAQGRASAQHLYYLILEHPVEPSWSEQGPLSLRSSPCRRELRFHRLLTPIRRSDRWLRVWRWAGGRQRLAQVQMIVVQHGVEQQRVAAAGFTTPERIEREHHDVPFTDRQINHRRMTGKLVAGSELAAIKKIARVGKTQYHARTILLRNDVSRSPVRSLRRHIWRL